VRSVLALIGSERLAGTPSSTIEGINEWLNALKKVGEHYR